MAVQSKDLKNGKPVDDDALFAQLLAGAPSRRPGAVLKRSQLRQARGWFERAAAIAVLFLSLIGSLLTWSGGIGPLVANPGNGLTWGLAIGSQAVLTAIQWMYRAQGFTHPWYLGSLALDMILTVLGYGPVVAPWLTRRLIAAGLPLPVEQAAIIAWAIVTIAAFAMAWYPEDRLVD